MRFVLLALLCGLMAAAAGAVTYEVPDEDLGIVAIQQAVILADPGDTVLVMSGTYDSVHTVITPLGVRNAIVSLDKDIVLMCAERGDAVVSHAAAEYGIVCIDVSRAALIANLTIVGGGGSRDQGLVDDGDGRFLTAGIACFDAASPTIRDVDIEQDATGVVIRTNSADSAPLIEGVVVARGTHHGVYVYDNGATPVIIDRCTFVDNFDYGIYVSGGTVDISNCAITHNGKYGVKAYLSDPDISYCNVYWNDRMFPDGGIGPLEYGGSLDDLTGIDGNISAEPFYCDFIGTSGYSYSVCDDSPHAEGGEGGVTIGARPIAGCECVSPVEHTSWGAIKALYR